MTTDATTDDGPAVVVGSAALRRLGVRAGLLYLLPVVVGAALVVPLSPAGHRPGAGPAPAPHSLSVTAGLLATLGLTAVLIRGQVRRTVPARAAVIIALGAAAAAAVHHVAGAAPGAAALASDVATAVGVCLALTCGPLPGLAGAALVGTAAAGAVPLALGRAPAPLDLGALIGPLISTLVAAGAGLLLGRGLRRTDEVLAGADEVTRRADLADRRWQARRTLDRDLHDTVLATLTLLARRDVELAPATVRERCLGDLALLDRPDPVEVPEAGGPAPAAGLPAELQGPAGLVVCGHGDSWAQVTRALPGGVLGQLLAAARECLTNTARHSGAGRADVVIAVTDRSVSLTVIDNGSGFDPEQVPEDRLGLARSVRGRLQDVGGSATVWTRPGAGTTVVLRVPRPDPEEHR